MNVALLIAVVCLILGTALGCLLVPLGRYLRRRGKTLFVLVNPNTGSLGLLYKRNRADHLKLEGGDVPLAGDFRFTEGGNRPAFIVDEANGLPLKPEHQGLITLTGQRLKEIRKGIKIKLIASANAADLEALAKYALLGIAIVGVLLLGAVVMIFKTMKATGAA